MGSKAWRALTPFDPDVRKALSRIQDEVFARGEFGFHHWLRSAYLRRGEPPPEMPAEPVAQSIDHARELSEGCGTCSVLDVQDIGQKPGFGVAGQFPAKTVLARLGTDHPSLDQLETVLGEFYEDLKRGHCAYFVCHLHGIPSHYLFIGMTPD
jgi:hypothetical protein